MSLKNGRQVRLALIGAGRIGTSYIQATQMLEHVSVAAIVDSRHQCAQALADQVACPSYESHTELLEKCPIDAAIIASTPATHVDICLDLLREGIPVLCEKPVSFDVRSARRIAEVAAERGALFTMASKFRYVEDVIKAKSIITSGILGEIVLFENTFMSRVDMRSRWNSQPTLSGGGVLIDNGTHSVDLMRYLLGPLSSILVVEGKRTQGLAVEDTVRVLVRSQEDVIGNIDLSWSLNKEVDHYLAVYGSHGTLRVGWKESTYCQTGSSDWVVFGKGYNKVEAFRKQIENFTAGIRGEAPLLITAEDAIASVDAIQAGYRALERGCWVYVGEAATAVPSVQ